MAISKAVIVFDAGATDLRLTAIDLGLSKKFLDLDAVAVLGTCIVSDKCDLKSLNPSLGVTEFDSILRSLGVDKKFYLRISIVGYGFIMGITDEVRSVSMVFVILRILVPPLLLFMATCPLITRI